jgi:hypothetical protein
LSQKERKRLKRQKEVETEMREAEAEYTREEKERVVSLFTQYELYRYSYKLSSLMKRLN